MNNYLTYSLHTLGCKLNFSESSTLIRYFEKEKFIKKSFKEKADVYIINTCTVTANSDKKSRNAISRAQNKNPNAIIIVTGCYAQLQSEEIKKKFNVDYIVGTNDRDKIKDIIKNIKKQKNVSELISKSEKKPSFFSSYSIGNWTRAFLKIQDGCDYNCSYCVVPIARGKNRNISIKNVLEQIDHIASKNIKEIVLTGVNIGSFGNSTNESFYELLQNICNNNKDIKRFRLGSIEPDLLSDEIIKLIANNSKIMPHFHIPIQSGSNDMLRLMNRKYDTELIKSKINLINELFKNAFIGADIIAGVNGETDKYFEETVDFLKSVKISSIHVFTYSEREKTKAPNFCPKISPTIKKERASIIKQISNNKLLSFLNTNLNHRTKVLYESPNKEGKMIGFSENYIKVETNYEKKYLNKIIDVELTEIINFSKMNGKILSNI